jgi:predicted  nucleic acid-binding Zn-ribbon protein
MSKELISEIDQLKRDLAFKREELQALYLEFKNKNNLIEKLEKENHSYKQQIKQLEKEAEEMLLYP